MANTNRLGSSPADRAPHGARRPLRIIVADDERDTVLTLMMILRDEGHDVRSADNGPRVCRLVQDFDPDAVVLDIGLPEMSGWQVAQQIRERAGERKPFLIAITGRYKQGADKILAELSGFDHYLVKPFDPAALLALLAPLTLPNADPQ